MPISPDTDAIYNESIALQAEVEEHERVDSRGIHRSRLIISTCRAYKLDNGVQIPEHFLYRFACSCGWEGAASYAAQERAYEHWRRHAE